MALSGLLPDPPEPPNPMATASAQTGTNVSTAIANSYLGNTNQVTPQGSLSNDVTSTYSFTDPTSGQTFNIPRWTSTQSQLDPAGYLQRNPDVLAAARSSGMDPVRFALQHYNQSGQIEGRYGGPLVDTQQQSAQAQLNLARMANQQSGMLGNMLNQPFNANFNAQAYLQANPDVAAAARASGQDVNQFAQQHYQQFGQAEGRAGGMPQMGDMGLYDQVGDPMSTYADAGPLQDTYGSGGDITRSYGPEDNFSADRQRVEDAMMARLNPQLQLENERVRQRLSDQGIRAGVGEDAYDAGMDVYNRQANDARFAAIQQAGQEQQRMSEMARAQATFKNQAQAQAEQQAAARGAFFNAAEQARYEQIAQKAGFYNQAQAQKLGLQSAKFNAQNQLRNQALQEAYQQRGQPINEIAALMSGSQLSQPNFINASRSQIPTTDIAGLINQNFAQQNDIFKTQTGFFGDIIGGALGFGGQLARSDRRVKEEIEPMGSVFGNGKKLPIYQYQFKDDPSETRHTGPMAQDVEKLDPRAVTEIDGVKHIKLDRMGAIFGRG